MSEDAIKLAVLEERLSGHEKVCAERYGEIKAQLGKIFWTVVSVLGVFACYALATWAPWVS